MLKFDEFMAHFDLIKVLNGETKCSKPKRQNNTSSSAMSKKGVSKLQRGENIGQTALFRFSNMKPSESTLKTVPLISNNQSKVNSVSKSKVNSMGKSNLLTD